MMLLAIYYDPTRWNHGLRRTVARNYATYVTPKEVSASYHIMRSTSNKRWCSITMGGWYFSLSEEHYRSRSDG
jgi:hypothetical protein